MTLDRFGAGCRCLLRARENLGNPPVSDRAFIQGHSSAYPDWSDTPGAATPERLIELSEDLGLGKGGHVLREYEHVLASHLRGDTVLVRTLGEPKRAAGDRPGDEQLGLLLEMDLARLTIWAPASDGSAETLTHSREAFWEPAQACGIILHSVHKRDA